MACILAELKNIRDENWDDMGQLQQSLLRPHAERLLEIFECEAEENMQLLRETLGPEVEEDWHGNEETRRADDGGTDPGMDRQTTGPTTSRRKERRTEPPRPTAELLRAAREINKDPAVLNAYLTQATAKPSNALDERQQLAFEMHSREPERARRNREIRATSRAQNRQNHQSSVRPSSVPKPLANTLPDLPPTVDFDMGGDGDKDHENTRPATTKRCRKQYHQPLKSGMTKPTRAGKKMGSGRAQANAKTAKSSKAQGSKPAVSKRKKLPKSSDMRKAQGEDEEDEDADPAPDGA